VRNLLVALGLVVASLAIVAGKLWQDAYASARSSELQRRHNYLTSVLAFFAGHDLWKSNPIIQKEFRHHGGGHGSGTSETKDFIFRVESSQLQREVLSTLIQICHDMDVFSGPQVVNVSDEGAILASPEGWLRMRASWPAEDPPVTTSEIEPRMAIHVLRVDYDWCFQPLQAPTEKQHLRRLDWVSWPPQLIDGAKP
jgi:hypothetical protein